MARATKTLAGKSPRKSSKKSPIKKSIAKKSTAKSARSGTKTVDNSEVRPVGRASSKSGTQPNLARICAAIKKLMKNYEPPFEAVSDFDVRYELQSPKMVSYMGRPPKKIYFAAVIMQSSYVGFYFMPVYATPKMTKSMPPDLMKCLKGKACFHIKSDEPAMLRDIKTALDRGAKCYKEMGWL